MQELEQLLAEGIIDEVHGRLKTGKEAEVFLVSHKGEVVAAKVYKARRDRNFKNNAGYMEGRVVRNTRTQRAMNNGSRFGQKMAEDAWKQAEADALFTLHAAGARVPKPVLFYEGVLLMEAVPDPSGNPAPRLIDAHIPAEQAAEMYGVLRAQVVKLLCADLIHGDLSPYNVLLGWDGPVIIDFPQVIKAAHNSRAEQFFKRDVENVRRFFATLDPKLDQHVGDAEEIWRAYVRRQLSPDFVPSGKPPPPRPQQGEGRGPQQHARGGGGPQHHGRGPGGGGPQQHQRGGGGPQQHERGGGGPQQHSRGGGGPQQHERGGGGGPQQHQRGGGPQQHERGGGGQQQHQRGGGPQQHERGGGGPQQHHRGGGPQQHERGGGPQEHQRGGGPPQHERGGGGGPQQHQRGGGGGQNQRQRGGGGPRGPVVEYKSPAPAPQQNEPRPAQRPSAPRPPHSRHKG